MENIQLQIDRFLRTGEGQFEPLALQLFAYQFQKNLPYQAYVLGLGVKPETVRRWIRAGRLPEGDGPDFFEAFALTAKVFAVAGGPVLFEGSVGFSGERKIGGLVRFLVIRHAVALEKLLQNAEGWVVFRQIGPPLDAAAKVA